MEILRFGLVGLAATATHVGVALAVLWLLPSMSVFVINMIGFMLAFFVSYYGHSRFTFRHEGSVLKFLATTLIGLTVNMTVLYAAVSIGMMRGLAVTLAATIAPGVVFLLSKLWVFRPHPEGTAQRS